MWCDGWSAGISSNLIQPRTWVLKYNLARPLLYNSRLLRYCTSVSFFLIGIFCILLFIRLLSCVSHWILWNNCPMKRPRKTHKRIGVAFSISLHFIFMKILDYLQVLRVLRIAIRYTIIEVFVKLFLVIFLLKKKFLCQWIFFEF